MGYQGGDATASVVGQNKRPFRIPHIIEFPTSLELPVPKVALLYAKIIARGQRKVKIALPYITHSGPTDRPAGVWIRYLRRQS